MDKQDLARAVINGSLDDGLDTDEIVRELQRAGLTFASGPRDPDDVKAIDLLNRWFWLMRDVADGRAFSRMNYNNEYHALHETPDDTGVFDDPPEGVENWCGTTAGAVGVAVLAGLFDGIELTLQDGKVAGEPNWDFFTGNDILLTADYDKINSVEPYEDPAEAAVTIAGVLESRYGTMPTTLLDHERPWLGVDAPFEPKPKPVMRW